MMPAHLPRLMTASFLMLGVPALAGAGIDLPDKTGERNPTTQQQGKNMPDSKNQVPPDVTRFLKGATPASRQFDFLIGDWDVTAKRFNADGTVLFQYKANWTARHLNEGRMIMDDFKALAPTGQEISSFVTLRTYSEVSSRWEMTGLAALQPAPNAEWNGIWTDGEMRLEAFGLNGEGKRIKTRIRFFNIEKNNFEWQSKASLDDGMSWALTAALTASRIHQ
jgi:hypothetical protein